MAAVSADKFDFDVCMPTYDYVFQPDVLRNKVAFITGGGSGICFTIAEVFMRHQCQTVIASRNLQRVQVAAKKLEKATGQQCLPLQLDVRKPQDVMKGVDAALGHFGKIDILINGAAGNFLVPASGLSYNGFRTVMDIDAMGTYNTSKAVYDKYMNKHGGVIMNISATLAYRGQMFQLHAAAAKAAIDSMTRTLCNEWGPQGIRVVGIAPGPIGDTEGMRRLGGGSRRKQELERRFQNIPLQRVGTKREIAECAVFVASPAASYLTGHTIVVDGGSWMTGDNNQETMRRRLLDAKLGGGFLGKEGLDKLAQNLPLQRVGTKCDIADCAVFLASPAASYISGHTVVVDGGSWMTDDNNIEAMAKRVDNAKL